MKFELNSDKKHLFILGAGASVDYGLPTWEGLGPLIVKRCEGESGEHIKYRNEILSWLNKVGEGKEYDTIDRCITKESRSKEFRSNGLTIEDNIFLIMKDIFKDVSKDNEEGWISRLNQKILDRKILEHQISFVNYNYDSVLDENILYFDHLTQKERDVDYRSRIGSLASSYIPVFYPHGNFFSDSEHKRESHLYRRVQTNKTELKNVLDAISCHESAIHAVEGTGPIKLYILGLGGGLKINLGNISINLPISEIHITIRDKSKKEEILKFLGDTYNVPVERIKVYSTCDDLIENSLNN